MSWFSRVILICLVARAAVAAPADLGVDLRLTAHGTEQRDAQSRVMGLRVLGDFSTEVAPPLTLRLSAEASLEIGTSRAAFLDEFGARQTLSLKEASAEWRPIDSLALRLGALDLSFVDMPLLVSSQTFAGARERAEGRWGEWRARLEACQAIASSPNMAFFTAAPGGELPLFFLERLAIGWEREGFGLVEARLSHFAFAEPSTEVARRSRFLGSTVIGLGPARSRFVFAHQGIEVGLVFVGKTRAWIEPRATASVLGNLAAPSGMNRSTYLSGGAAIRVASETRLVPSIAWYRAESDTVPALYTAKELGHGNRQGFVAEIKLEIPRSGIEAGAAFSFARPLGSNPYQTDFYYGNLFFGMRYDVL